MNDIEKFHNVMYFMGKSRGTPVQGGLQGELQGGLQGGLQRFHKVNPGGTPGETRLMLEVKRTDAWQQYVYLEMI